jgi:hypothetical protein
MRAAAIFMTEDRVLHLFHFVHVPLVFLPSLVTMLPSLVTMLPGVATIDSCCGADYQGQNHRQPDAKNRPS